MPTDPPVSDLPAHLGYWLRMVSNHVSHGFAARLAGEGVTVAEWVVLRTLHGAPPTPPSQVAAALGMTRGAITKLADRLIAKGLAARAANAADRRAQTLALTPRGAALVPVLARHADRNDAEAFAALSADERAALAAMLQRLAAQGGIRAVPID